MRVSSIAIVTCAACGFESGVPPPSAGPDASGSNNPPMIDAGVDALALGPWGMPQVVPGTLLNTEFTEDDPSLTADMLELYFGSNRPLGSGGEDIWVAQRASIDDSFGQPVLVAALSSTFMDSNVEVSADGLTIVFTSTRGGMGADLFIATRSSRSAAWEAPVRAQVPQPMPSDEWGAVIDNNRQRVVLCSDRSGNEAIYTAQRAGATGPFSDPAMIADIETPAHECDAMLPDANTIYFTSTRTDLGAKGDLDLYAAQRAGIASPFGPIENLETLNTTFRDSDPWVSPNQRVIVFSSNRIGISAADDDLFFATR